VRAESPLSGSRVRRRGRGRSALSSFALGAGVIFAVSILVGLAFAGSSGELADGTRISGVDVGGLNENEAVAKLSRRYRTVSGDRVAFRAGESTFPFAAEQLGVVPDWRAAVTAAARTGDGFGPVRGFRRLHTRFFGAEVLPSVSVSNAALAFALDRIGDAVDREPKSAALIRRGLRIELIPARVGRRLDRTRAGEVIVRTLGSIERTRGPILLPVGTARPAVSARMLEPAARRARIALSAPVFLRSDGRGWRLPRTRIAELLALPSEGGRRLTIGGPKADAYFRALSRRVGEPPVDAAFDVSDGTVRVIPSRPGRELDVPSTARALLRAATSRTHRTTKLVVVRAPPERTTAEARAMGIKHDLGSYKTYNAGTWDRITNLRLGVTLLDDTTVPPGGTFSLNAAIGERTEERGFRTAPVIIGTKYEEEVGGGTSQVATTAFNAAWEAGLRITERNPHSLYISRYPLGRDATVYWPTLDLKFVNDTRDWILVKGIVEADGIRIAIYGGERRRVESSAGTMTVTGSPPVERLPDPTLPVGQTYIEQAGSSPSRTTVTRKIYAANGELLRTETWNTSYKGETRIVRFGTKPKEPPKPPEAPEEPPVTEKPKPPPKDEQEPAPPQEEAPTLPPTRP
jgi:vancomycin resistance protein YoaR